MRGVFVLVLGLLGWPALAVAHEAKHEQHEGRLPTIAAAPDFALISQVDLVEMLLDLGWLAARPPARLLGERVHPAADAVDVGHSPPFRLSKYTASLATSNSIWSSDHSGCCSRI